MGHASNQRSSHPPKDGLPAKENPLYRNEAEGKVRNQDMQMDLSPEQRERIIAEEKARLEAVEQYRREARKKPLPPLVVIVVLAGTILLLSVPFFLSEKPDVPDSYDAAKMCEDFVKDRLKTPGAAKFPDPYDLRDKGFLTSVGENRFTVKSWVDSQNSYGALLRTRFTCSVRYIGKNRWELEDLTFKD